LSMPNWRILEQSNPGGTSAGHPDRVVTLYWPGDWARLRACEEVPTLGMTGFAFVASPPKATKETPVTPTNRPIKTRRLKNADWEVDFFFMNGYEVNGVWM
jgi:hypothetical protein